MAEVQDWHRKVAYMIQPYAADTREKTLQSIAQALADAEEEGRRGAVLRLAAEIGVSSRLQERDLVDILDAYARDPDGNVAQRVADHHDALRDNGRRLEREAAVRWILDDVIMAHAEYTKDPYDGSGSSDQIDHRATQESMAKALRDGEHLPG